ncbi:hypothetical protein MPSEU_000245700 [Mayamaea pseudoterrestris]|nr:hypothetical protein MPSEU_000245700 [Mayamaea pseudoterrestris]
MSEPVDGVEQDQKMPTSDKTPFLPDSGSDTDEHHHALDHELAADGHKTAAKPALKKNREQQQESDHQKKQLKFDEETIAEHNKLRGTRQSIDEPNTPYHAQYDSGAESDGSGRCKSPANQKPSVDWDLLQTRLDSVAAVQQTYPSSPSASSCQADDEEVVDDRKSEMRQLEFKEHRKRHYNEMELVRRFRSQHSDDAVAEGDDDANFGRNGDDYDRNADADNEHEDDDEDED